MITIFIDESGSLMDEEDNYFIIVGIFTENPKSLRKLIYRTRKAKLSSRDRGNNSEIKSSKATDKYKKYFYEHLNKIEDFEIFGLYLKIEDIPLHMKGKEGLIYLRMTEELLRLAQTEKYNSVSLIMDDRSLKGLTRNAFDTALHEKFGASFNHPKIFNIFHADSQKEKGIQVCDFITHAVYQKFQRKNNVWYELIRNKITKIRNAKEFL